MPEQELFTLHCITLHYIIYRYGFTLVFCNLRCIYLFTNHQCKLLWAWSSISTLQTTACAKEYLRTVVEDKDHQRKLQRVKNYTATIGVHDAASTCKLA